MIQRGICKHHYDLTRILLRLKIEIGPFQTPLPKWELQMPLDTVRKPFLEVW